MALTAKQQMFVKEYLVDLNATRAAIRAGYSVKTAEAIGHENLRKPKIAAAVEAAMGQRSQRTEVTADRVLQEYAKIAFFDPRRLYQDDGEPVDLTQLDDSTAGAIAGLEVLEEFSGSGDDRVQIGYTKKYRIADKVRALDSIARHLGMFNDRLKLEGELGLKKLEDFL
ncbi:terminase small subunit [Paenibacillus senegalimassiliensis]|uniref:terminase small subunit n=1 Tax=Paenibacillus senegalimassiliensis TaxID=1737426 RepID=UPI00073F7D99|nr:terminase small subunit [Paenibacillus senegalimassiliensis]